MNVFLRSVTVALCAVLIGLCGGCRSFDATEAAVASSAVVVVTPVAVGYTAVYAGNAGAQNSSIAIGAPEQWYSEAITQSDLWQKGMRHAFKFHEPWKYMGTKNGEHYLMLYPFLGFREIYRIDVSEYEIKEPFELTTRSSKWREITMFHHFGVVHEFVIEPPLFEQPGELAPLLINVDQMDGFSGDLGDQFMMEVPILEE